MGWMNWNHLPNIITTLRLILLIPLSFYLMKEDYQPALVLFFIAGASDALDGFLAKKFNWVSRFGSILDPIADKALIVVTMAILAMNGQFSFYLFALFAIRDIYIVAGAYYYYIKVGPFQMEPSYLSKLNTFLQVLLVTLLLVSLVFTLVSEILINYLIILVIISIITSTVHYTFVWIKKLKSAILLKKKLDS